MTSQLNVDTIVDKAGSGGTNVKVANTSTYVGEGGSGTQNTVQGLTKAWFHFDLTATAANRGSFNIASLTDNGTGNLTETFTNNMNNVTYATTGLAGGASSASAWADSITHSAVDNPCLTSSVSIYTSYNTSLADSERSAGQVDGDLA